MLESLFNESEGLKDTFKNNFFYRTPPLAASEDGGQA